MSAKHFLFLVAGLLCCGIIACKKNDGINQTLDPNNQTGYDFMPNKTNNWWYYGSSSGVMYHRFARNQDSVMLGATYSYFERRNDSSSVFYPEYFGKNSGYYLTLIDLDGSATNYVNYAFWKDSTTLGDTWKNTAEVSSPVGRVTITIQSSLADTGLTLVNDTRTFSRVTHVHSDATAGALNTRVGTLDIWFIKGIGVIREQADISVLGLYRIQHTDSLVDYHLEP